MSCNADTDHLGLELGQKLSKLSLKDHCSRDPVQVQSGNKLPLKGPPAKMLNTCSGAIACMSPSARCLVVAMGKILLGEEGFQSMKPHLPSK